MLTQKTALAKLSCYILDIKEKIDLLELYQPKCVDINSFKDVLDKALSHYYKLKYNCVQNLDDIQCFLKDICTKCINTIENICDIQLVLIDDGFFCEDYFNLKLL